MNNIKMIVTDLDRTLLRSDKSLSQYTKSVLHKCHQDGILIVFATARPERATRQLKMDNILSCVIANNGATITHKNECIKNIPIPEDIKHKLIKQFVGNKSITAITVEVGDFLYTNDKEHKNWSLSADWNAVYTDLYTPIKEESCKISVECKNTDIILEILREHPEVYLLPNNGENWYQIMHRDSSKFNAVSFISNLANIPIENIIAFGDDYNDVEMIEKCGIGVAVNNAVEEARRAADFICEDSDNDGLAKYLEQHVLCSY